MSLALCVILVGLANWQIIETWRHGSIFHTAWEWIGKWSVDNFFRRLLLCGFCSSHWPALALAWLSLRLLSADYNDHMVVCWLFIWLGGVRLSQWLNDVSHSHCRSPARPAVDNEEIFEVV